MEQDEIGTVLGIRGKVVAVAGGGGAKNGMGRATALLFAKLGAEVAVLDLNNEAAEVTRKEISELAEREASAWQVDVTDEAQVDQTIRGIVERYGRIDVWAHVAGGHKGATLIEDIPPAVWRANVELSLTSAFLCTRVALPIMKSQQKGKIVLVGSEAGLSHGYMSGADYASAKGGLISFTRQLAFEAGPFNINVNAVVPGPTHEPDSERDRADGRLPKVPLQRFSRPGDLAQAIVFLASSWADMITGATLIVDGGLLIARTDYETYVSKHKRPVSRGEGTI